MRVCEAIKAAQEQPLLVTILRSISLGAITVVAFLLHDEVEGTVFGLREFTDTTHFLDVSDFIYELWLSSDLTKVN